MDKLGSVLEKLQHLQLGSNAATAASSGTGHAGGPVQSDGETEWNAQWRLGGGAWRQSERLEVQLEEIEQPPDELYNRSCPRIGPLLLPANRA
eukprot:1790134-Pyramimonas_sp.AAC.2